MDENETKPAITRRQCLAGGAVAAVASAAPALAATRLDGRLSAPPGHKRDAPAFRRIDLGK